MSEQIKMCPYCKNTDGLEVIMIGMFYHVLCVCGANGPGSTAHIDAVLLWNAAANQIEALRADLAEAQDKRDKYYADWYAEHCRVEASDKRQDKLEAEIEQLRNDLRIRGDDHTAISDYFNQMKAEIAQLRKELNKAISERDA